MSLNKQLTIVLLLFFMGAIFYSTNAAAHHLLKQHQYNCSPDFPCPEKLHGRIDFWVSVFSEWDREKAIFHDPDVPDRVYSVVDTGHGCSRRVSRSVKKERERLKRLLNTTAKKINDNKTLNKEQQHIAALFDFESKQLQAARSSIRCQSGVQDSYISGLERFNRYQFMVDKILQQYNLPSDIRYLPFVESSYNPTAYSKAGAAGMWQIMPKTARVLGLELNAAIDERLEPEASTRAASKYLVDARRVLTEYSRSIDPDITDSEISPFVITSYNYGVGGMKRAIRNVRPDYIDVINNHKSPRFQVAVKNFYASFLAARHIAINSEAFFDGLVLENSTNHNAYILKVDTSIRRIEEVFRISEKQLKLLNLGLTRFVWRGWRLVPAGYRLHLPYRQDGYQDAINHLQSLPVETVAPGAGDYIVRKGDTACGIARALRVNCAELIRFNGLNKKAIILVGQKLSIPGQIVLADNNSAKKTNTVTRKNTATTTTYRVKRGDSACLIAKRYGVSCRQLIRVNGLGRKAIIQIGQRLVIPGHISSRGVLLDENNRYLVRKGDSLCRIATKLSVNCTALRTLNKINTKAVIHPGQRLIVPGYQLPDSSVTAGQLANTSDQIQSQSGTQNNDALTNLLDSLPDLTVSISGEDNSPQYSIIVEADETIGHYADWLGLASTQSIRRINRLKKATNLAIGRRIQLPIESSDMLARFEQKRIDFHQILSESLKDHFVLVEIRSHVVIPGDSVWDIARTQGFPLWLLYRINPGLHTRRIQAGQRIKVPILQSI